jgi:hypothetical protein
LSTYSIFFLENGIYCIYYAFYGECPSAHHMAGKESSTYPVVEICGEFTMCISPAEHILIDIY